MVTEGVTPIYGLYGDVPLNRVYFCRSDSGTCSGLLFCWQNRAANEHFEGQPRLTQFQSGTRYPFFTNFSGIGQQNCVSLVWNRVGVPRHSAAHSRPRLRGELDLHAVL